jgi:hypothetical protein
VPATAAGGIGPRGAGGDIFSNVKAGMCIPSSLS